MEAILTVLYLAIIICAALLTGFGVYSLYQMGQAAKETRKTMKLTNEELTKIDGAITAASQAVKSVGQTIQTAADALNKPMDGVIRGIRVAQTLIQKFRDMGGKAATGTDDDDETEEDFTESQKPKAES